MSTSLDQTWGSDAGTALPVAIEVLRRGPISRAEIGRRLGLSHASLSRLSAPLIERGVIHDVGEHSNGRVGRPSRLLDVDASSHHFLGIKIRETEIIAAVTDLRGEVVDSVSVPLDDRNPTAVVAQVKDLHRAFAAAHTITAVGIGIGGAVHERRTIISAGFLGWDNVALSDLIEQETQTPTLVENDVVALCEYEDWFGFASNDERFAVITLGIGTGFGLVINGQPIVGDDYGFGLVGHWPMDPTGPLCQQGHRGCAAALLNSDAIARYATEALGRDTTFDETIQLAADGDPAASRIIHDAARGVGVLIAAVCNLTLPDRIIIAGEGVRLAVVGHDTLVEKTRELRDPRAHTPPINYSSGDNVEWARGAAVLAIQAFALGSLAPVH
ncbi:ROK family transcriptional regulator [Microbacterium trichothecenolyticum]|uniref:ROK family protein n=1 Tax=Microbacterium trichothecenolyticum TaxID=69370 RepID=UPI001C6ED858|nr:ROK family protein [Microbacterium trichothecenolyticum]MBW9119844.1 ROK family transcriptional regulator [Microbacterium trichothecenolyticum]